MIVSDFYRFRKTDVESNTLFRGETCWYRIGDREDRPVLACRLVGNGMGGPSTFHARPDAEAVLFRLSPRRRLMNRDFDLAEGARGPGFAALRLEAGRGVTAAGPDGAEWFRVVDAGPRAEELRERLPGGGAPRFAVVAGDALLGRVEALARPGAAGAPPSAGLLGRLRRKVLGGGPGRDWCVELVPGPGVLSDHRPLLAAMLLLVEQTIRRDKSP
jgi:hypothetical protein